MYLFKTSGKTFESVIKNAKHAFKNKPSDWAYGEIVLISKNRKDLKKGEKQIRYIMRISNIREASHNEISKYWPTEKGRWRYIVDCYDVTELKRPFDLEEILG